MKKKLTLAVMAAGIGSRFGKGIKQLEKVGPGGQIIMDYSIHDAIAAGFDKVVFIIRKDLEADFREIIGKRVEEKVEVVYAFQEKDDLPAGFTCPPDRTKPWGTGQAILACRGLINEPFAVINADDFYGREPFEKLYGYLSEEHPKKNGVWPICMAAFRLGNTLSDNGGVTRGICRLDAQRHLIGIDETANVIRTESGAAVQNGEELLPLDVNAPVSMNLWGLQPEFINLLGEGFKEFLAGLQEGDLKKEFLLPIFIDELLHKGEAEVQVLDTKETWFGITYAEDKDAVVKALAGLTAKGVYPAEF